MTEPALRCSDRARERADEPGGTAPPATRWLLIEYPGAWPVDALGGSRLDTDVRDRLIETAGRRGIRILLIRRPLRRGSAAPTDKLWTVITRGAGEVRGHWRSDHDLFDAVAAMETTPPLPHHTDAPPQLILVCAHGVHDVCCALRGRPVAAALAERWSEQTWECSHVGGDRFAANVVVLPDGVYYGNLDPNSAVRVIGDHLEGRVSFDHLRGISGFPPAAQAVMGEIHRRRPELRAGALDLAAISGDRDHGWTLQLNAHDAIYHARVSAEAGPVDRLTCRAAREGRATLYRIGELEAESR